MYKMCAAELPVVVLLFSLWICLAFAYCFASRLPFNILEFLFPFHSRRFFFASQKHFIRATNASIQLRVKERNKNKKQIESHHEQISLWLLLLVWCACTCCHRCFVQFDRHNHKPISLCCIQTHFYAFIFSCFELSHFCLYKLRNKKGDRRKEYEENHSFRQSRYLIQAFLFGANGAPKIILNILLHVWCFGFLGFWLRVRPSLPCRCKHRFVVHLSLCH